MDVQLTFPIRIPNAGFKSIQFDVYCAPFNACDITLAVLCLFLTQDLSFRMCNMRSGSTLNIFAAPLLFTRKSQTGSLLASGIPEQIASTGTTDTQNETCTNCRHQRTEKNFQDNSHYTEMDRLKTYTMITLENDVYTARFVMNLVAHVD